MKRNRSPFRIALVALIASLPCVFAGLALAKSSQPAVYTLTQAHHGKRVFSAHCAVCHGSNMQGKVGPALKGRMFSEMASGQHLTAKRLLSFISKHMPKSNPGSLTAKQYREVAAYILSQNGYPSGSTKLKESNAKLSKLKLYGSSGHSAK